VVLGRAIIMNVVLFLGAGFSRAYGLPVMREFFDHVRNAAYLEPEDKTVFDEYRRKTNNSVNMFEPDYDNLEDVLSFCLAAENFAGAYPEEMSEDYQRLCTILQQVYRRLGGDNLAYWKLDPAPLRRLLALEESGVPESCSYTFITTNYDIILEYLLQRLGLACSLPCKWQAIEPVNNRATSMYQNAGSAPLLCKLHGSINWFSSPEDTTELLIEDQIVRGEAWINQEDDWPKSVEYPKVASPEYSPPHVPLIIPPTLFKLRIDRRFQRMWDAAGKALNEADKVIFIGFSFPPSDTYIRYFLTANLAQNVRLARVAIIDPDAEGISNRLKEPGSKFGTRFKHLLQAFACKWQAGIHGGAVDINL
jgi:hypothetical protein